MGPGRKAALVTGAAGGLGRAIAQDLAARGHDLVLTDLGAEAVADLARALEADHGIRACALAFDLTDDAGRPQFVRQAFAAFGRLDTLVNNAGVSVLSRGDILDVAPESFDRCVAVNLRAQFFLTQAVARAMIAAPVAHRRAIVGITTVALDHMVGRVLAEYCISKAGLSHAMQHFAVRLVREGIDCFEIRPGMMQTAMTAGTSATYDAMIAGGAVPAGRWGQTAEVAQAVGAMADGALPYAVGQVLHIDGGFRLKPF